jgi:ribose 5-phosphate isomerase A
VSSEESGKFKSASEACRILKSNYTNAKLVGLGTGSTVRVFIDTCIDYLRDKGIYVSSVDTAMYLYSRLKLRPVDLHTLDYLDVYIDGADEVSSRLDLVKGRGGALLREKLLALSAATRIYVVDYTKYTGVEYLYAKPIPVEVVPASVNYAVRELRRLGFEPQIRVGGGRDGPVISDNGNYIVDLKPLKPIVDAKSTHEKLKLLHGVVETGIFPGVELVDVVVVGHPDRAVTLRRPEK